MKLNARFTHDVVSLLPLIVSVGASTLSFQTQADAGITSACSLVCDYINTQYTLQARQGDRVFVCSTEEGAILELSLPSLKQVCACSLIGACAAWPTT